MESSFGPLDAFVFVVFAILIAVVVVVIVSLGKLPGQLARKWHHPQAAAINVAGWVGVATGGLLWPLAFIWAFTAPSESPASKNKNDQERRAVIGPGSLAHEVDTPGVSNGQQGRP